MVVSMNENQNQDFEFLKEKIKEKPINRKKLIRRMIITVSMAVVFGLVACLTFLVLEPVISNWLYPEEEAKVITLPEEEKEIGPEDMLQQDPEQSEPVTEVPAELLEKLELGAEDYEKLYASLRKVADEAYKGIVTVTGVTSDVDLLDNPFESKGQTSGTIVVDNGKELMILARKEPIQNAETIRVTFVDGKQAEAVLKKEDATTGLAIFSVDMNTMDADTKDKIALAELGSSSGSGLLGSPVIALGSPLGYADSISYGMITSAGNTLRMEDCNYNLLTTDILGSTNASGVLINLKGQVLGILHQGSNNEDMKNAVSALGITELRSRIDKMLSQQDFAYLGVYASDVTPEANSEQGVPLGVYVSKIEMDSPAMAAGIQSGDIIIRVNETDTASAAEYSAVLRELQPGAEAALTILRQSKGEYQEMSVDVVTGTLK